MTVLAVEEGSEEEGSEGLVRERLRKRVRWLCGVRRRNQSGRLLRLTQTQQAGERVRRMVPGIYASLRRQSMSHLPHLPSSISCSLSPRPFP